MIKFEQVSKHYGPSHQALNNISFELISGTMTFLTGHSGAGKSTLMKLIMRIESPSRGHVIVDGKNLNKLSVAALSKQRRSIGVIFQNPMLLCARTVFENVALPLHIADLTDQEIKHRARAALDKVGLLNKEKCAPNHLSAGEQQRVGIARAIVNRPRILLADEPTGNLDPALSADIMKLFLQFNQVGTTVLVATHDLSLIAALNHPILHLNKGMLSQESTHV